MVSEQLIKPTIQLSGKDGNAFAILATARRAALEHGLDWERIKTEALSDDYDHLLQTLMEYFEII